MSTPIDTINKSSYVRKEEPGFLENLGVKYYHYLGKKSGTAVCVIHYRRIAS
jgi:hypothetical protein